MKILFFHYVFDQNKKYVFRKIPKILILRILDFGDFGIFRKNIFCFDQKHNEKNKIFKIKIYFCKLTILNLYVSNLQLPTPSNSLLGKVNVSEFLDFPQSDVLPSSPSHDLSGSKSRPDRAV